MKFRELFQKKSIRYGLAGFASSLGVYGIYFMGKPVVEEYRGSFAAQEFREYGVLGAYQKRFFNFKIKLNELMELDRENQRLNQKLALMEKDLELSRAQHAETEAQMITNESQKRLKQETGSELARVLNTIEYQAPTQLLPPQLYTLAVGYFRKHEYEQAAVILSKLVEMKEDTSYQRAETQLMCGVAWYKLKHYKLSQYYLDQAKSKSKPTDSSYRTAMVWDALVAKAVGDESKANSVVTSIISRYPHSPEADWVNRSNARKPASRERDYSGVVMHLDETQEAKELESKPKIIHVDEPPHSPRGPHGEEEHEN